MILNNAANVMYGNIQVEKIYLGSEEIWSKEEGLPAEYQQVKYLESSGTQYLKTPWRHDIGNPNPPDIHIECKCCINDNYSIFGNKECFNLTGASGFMKFRGYTYYSGDVVQTDVPIGSTPILWRYDTPNLTADGVLKGTLGKTHGSGFGDPIYLFCRYSGYYGQEIEDIGGTCRIWGFKVSEDSTKICNMIPCYRKSDNKPGMYDLVTRTFYTNEGTGEFTIGQ